MPTSSAPAHGRNVGRTDRALRLAAAAVLLALALLTLDGLWAVVALVVAAILAGTALLGFCPLYRLLGISTCPAR